MLSSVAVGLQFGVINIYYMIGDVPAKMSSITVNMTGIYPGSDGYYKLPKGFENITVNSEVNMTNELVGQEAPFMVFDVWLYYWNSANANAVNASYVVNLFPSAPVVTFQISPGTYELSLSLHYDIYSTTTNGTTGTMSITFSV